MPHELPLLRKRSQRERKVLPELRRGAGADGRGRALRADTGGRPVGGDAGLKDFVQSPVCPEKVRKSIKSSWIILLVCAVLTLAFEIIMGILPIDAVLLAVFAFWLRGKYSMTPAILALALGIIGVIVGYVQNGTPSGILVVFAGSTAVSSLLRAKKLFDEYKKNGTL